MADLPELKLALFGQSGAGKTTFFASYYGTQNSDEFRSSHGYWLRAKRPTQGNTLRGRFHRMQQGMFPDGTDTVEVYKFDLMVGNLPDPGMMVSWLDYPGGWWEVSPRDDAERIRRREALVELTQSHAIILLLDGQKYLSIGHTYVRDTIYRFSMLIEELKQESHESGQSAGEMPQTILLAITKADLLPEDQTAKRIAEFLLAKASNEANRLAHALGTESNPANFLSDVVLLSSAYVEDGGHIDMNRTMSLNLIAPIVLASILADAAKRAGRGAWHGRLAAILEGLAHMLQFIEHLDNFLPEKYKFVTKLVDGLHLEEFARSGARDLREAEEKARQRQDSTAALAAAMFRELEEARNTRAFYRISGNH